MPNLKPFKSIQIGDLQTGIFQQNVVDWTNQIQPVSTLGGAFFRVMFPAAGQDVTINHGQGTANVEWLPGSQNSAGNVYLSPTKNMHPASQLILRAQATLTALIWIFPTPAGVS